ncbi:MAG TPA: hypothetical protein VHA06_05860, partial [Candidatus Angelobacter sp.]|nr:hypothetical protein [Candidatus Angelobacter sp.]
MKILRTAIISSTFLLAVGAFAQQYPGGQSAQPQAPQGSMQQASPGQASPNQPSSTQPSSTQPSSTQPSSTQPGQSQGDVQPAPQQPSQSAQAAGRPSIDDQVRSLSDQLNLSTDQQAKLKTALEDQHTQAMKVAQDSTLAREDK